MDSGLIKVVPLGGLGEIGLNMMAVEYMDSILVIDAGLMFPEDYMLGVDLVIPNMEYIKVNRMKVCGIILTHAHEDHIGALPYLLKEVDVPVYGCLFTISMVKIKLMEHDLPQEPVYKVVSPGENVVIDPFEMDMIRVSHSVIDGVAVAIKTGSGYLVHTGDFRIGQSPEENMITDIHKFARLGEEGVLALFSDSTNVEKEGYTISDKKVGESLFSIIQATRGRCIIALFASHIRRIQQIIDIALSCGRKVVISGRSIEASVSVARELGYLEIPEGIEIDINDVQDYPDSKLVIITTGTQGEPMSALARMAHGMHKQIKIKEGDSVILSSKFIPGNEKAIAHIINNLYRKGADVIYEKISDIHSSGHAHREELKLMLQLTKPRYFIPIHGEYRHLVLHARLAQGMGIPKDRCIVAENGDVLYLHRDFAEIKDRVAYGRVLVDGKGIGDVGKSLLKERRILSEEGFVAVIMALDEDTGIIIYGPEFISKGFVFEGETGHILEDAKCVILEIVDEMSPDIPMRLDRMRSRIQSELRIYFNFSIKRRPVILPFILEV